MITCRPGGYRWFALIEKMKKQEKYRIERQRIVDEMEKMKQHIATIKIETAPQSIRFNN